MKFQRHVISGIFFALALAPIPSALAFPRALRCVESGKGTIGRVAIQKLDSSAPEISIPDTKHVELKRLAREITLQANNGCDNDYVFRFEKTDLTNLEKGLLKMIRVQVIYFNADMTPVDGVQEYAQTE